MADILQMMIEFLRINCQLVNCYYPNPFEGIFYLILLPMVILIAFVYIIFWAVIKIPHTGIRLLIALVVLIFIILQGWFNIFITLSWLWVILIIIMGIWWSIRRKGPGESFFGGRGGGGKMPAAAGGLLEKVKGVTLDYGDLKKAAEQQLKEMEMIAANIKAAVNANRDPGYLFSDFETRRNNLVKILDNMSANANAIGGWAKIRSDHKGYYERMNRITDDIQKYSSSRY